MKFYFLILLFVLFVIVAIIVYFKYYLRYVLFKDMVYVSKTLKNNISFNKNQVKQILSDALKNVSMFTRYFISCDRGNKFVLISKIDRGMLNEFFSSIGKGDVSFELNNIAYYENNFEELKTESYEKLNKDGKMYLKLIIGVGLAFCILLI